MPWWDDVIQDWLKDIRSGKTVSDGAKLPSVFRPTAEEAMRQLREGVMDHMPGLKPPGRLK